MGVKVTSLLPVTRGKMLFETVCALVDEGGRGGGGDEGSCLIFVDGSSAWQSSVLSEETPSM